MTKETRFDIWCPSCVDFDVLETENPCNECLNEPFAEDSTRPLYFKQDPKKGDPTQNELPKN